MLKFNLKYFIATVIIFLIEVLIATIFKGIVFVRSYLGDVIVVILIYTFILSFFEIKNKNLLVLGVVSFSVLIEFLQYWGIADYLGLKPGSIAHIVVGSSFSWWDIACYFTGCMCILVFNKIKKD